MARPDQAATILDWLDGRREVAGDTSTVSGIRFHDRVLTVTAHADGRVDVVDTGAADGGAAR